MSDLIHGEEGHNLPQLYTSRAEPTGLQPYRPPSPFFEEEGRSLEQYMQMLRRRKWLLLSVAVTVVLLTAMQVFTATPLYKATTKVQIDPEDPNILPYKQVDSSGPQMGSEEYLWTQAEKLQTRDLARRVIDTLKLADNETFTEPVRQGALLDLVRYARSGLSHLFGGGGTGDETTSALTDKFLGHLDVNPVHNTRLISVSFESPDPKLSAQITNTLAESFIEQHLEGKFEATARATDFLEKQLQSLQVKVEKSEEALLRYAQERNIVNISDRESIARKRLADLNDQLTAAKGELIAQQSRYAAVENATNGEFPEILKTESMGNLEGRLSTMENDLSGLSSSYGPEWPAVKKLRSQIAELRQQLASQEREAVSETRQQYELAQRRYTDLESATSEQRKLVDKLNEDSIQYNILKREADSNKALYQELLQRLKEAGVSAGLRSSNIRVADQADVPRFAASPKKARSIVLGLFLGLFVGIGAVLLAETLDNSVKTVDEMSEVYGLPVLGVVPHFRLTDGHKGLRKALTLRRNEPERPILVAADGNGNGHRMPQAIEAYQSLRTSLLLSHSGTPPQTILVSSSLPAEGKTTTAANTALALAQSGMRTALVDLDLRKPAVDRLFGVPSELGMSTFLSGNSDLSSQIIRTAYPNLFVVPAGPQAPNPAVLIGSERMTDALQLLGEYFTYVVFDSPPVLQLSDALLLSPHVDGVILVVRSSRTPRKALLRARSQILHAGGRLLGVVVNDVDQTELAYGYYSYGAYYERYGESDTRQT